MASVYSVLHLSDIERATNQGLAREELIEWYLEQKEFEIESVADLDNEREIVTKALTRLVKDKYLMELRGTVGDSLTDETMNATSTDDVQIHYVVRKSLFPIEKFTSPSLNVYLLDCRSGS
jgi:DNA replication licensing factor MCM6